jgi:hypothetical protein
MMVCFGSPKALEIARLDRAVRLLDAELRKIGTWGTPYVTRYEVEIKTHLLSSDEISEQVFVQAWKHLLKSKRWVLFKKADHREDDQYQPNDEGVEGGFDE